MSSQEIVSGAFSPQLKRVYENNFPFKQPFQSKQPFQTLQKRQSQGRREDNSLAEAEYRYKKWSSLGRHVSIDRRRTIQKQTERGSSLDLYSVINDHSQSYKMIQSTEQQTSDGDINSQHISQEELNKSKNEKIQSMFSGRMGTKLAIKSSMDRNNFPIKKASLFDTTTQQHLNVPSRHTILGSSMQNKREKSEKLPKHISKQDNFAFKPQKKQTANKKDKRVLYDFLENILGNQDMKNERLTSANLIKNMNAPVIRQIPNHDYKGILETITRKRLRQLKPTAARIPSIQKELSVRDFGNDNIFDMAKYQEPGAQFACEIGSSEIVKSTRLDFLYSNQNSIQNTFRKNQDDSIQQNEDYYLKVISPEQVTQQSDDELEEQFQKECDDLMVSISHDWKAQMDIIDNNEAYEDPNQTLTLKMAKASELASELSGMRLFPTYQEVGTLHLNPLESIEPKKVTAIPIKGFSVSYKIRNSLLVKNLLNDRPLNVLNETQSRFNNSAYMTTSKNRLVPPKALNQSNFNQQADSNTSGFLSFDISVSSFNKALPCRRSSLDFRQELKPKSIELDPDGCSPSDSVRLINTLDQYSTLGNLRQIPSQPRYEPLIKN